MRLHSRLSLGHEEPEIRDGILDMEQALTGKNGRISRTFIKKRIFAIVMETSNSDLEESKGK